MNTCTRIQNRLSEYIDGALPSELAWNVQMHLAVCADCARVAHDMQRTVKLLSGAALPEVSSRFEAGLAAKLAAAAGQSPRKASFWRPISLRMQIRRRWAAAMIGATAAACVVATVVIPNYIPSMQHHTGSHAIVQPASTANAEASDMAFVAACTSQHAHYASAQSIADPAAEALAARMDESRAPVVGAASPAAPSNGNPGFAATE